VPNIAQIGKELCPQIPNYFGGEFLMPTLIFTALLILVVDLLAASILQIGREQFFFRTHSLKQCNVIVEVSYK